MSSKQVWVDCKRWTAGTLKRSREVCAVLPLVLTFGLAVTAAARADHHHGKQESDKQQPAQTTLTLESLYHPEQKVSHTTSTPATHWLSGETPILLVRDDERWMRVDLQDFSQQPWPVLDQLVASLQTLEGVDQQQAKETALSAVPKMHKESDSVLVKIGESLAVASADGLTRWLSRDAARWRNATLDPTARRLGYTTDGDLFVIDTRSDRTVRLTDDASDTMLDGVLDWTYQEEIFGRGNYRGFWFSPDGQWLAMMRIDISGIEPYVLTAARSERGQGVVRRYPKAGDPIPHAELYLWDLRNIDRGVVPPPRLLAKSTASEQRIVTGVWWHPDKNELLYAISDRLQTWRELHRVPAEALEVPGKVLTESTLLFREESPAWIEPPAAPAWLDDGGIIWKSEVPRGRTRLYRIAADGKVVTPITPDDFDVEDFAISGDESFAVITGDGAQAIADRQVYKVAMTPADAIDMQPITHQPGWHNADISPDANWIVDHYSTAATPETVVIRSTTDERSHQLASTKLKLKQSLIEPEIFSIPTPDGKALPAMVIKPPQAGEQQKMPVLIEVYGGPRAPVVANRFSGARTLYRELLARQGIATLVVDNRSSGGHGLADTWAVRGRMGELESQDVLHAVDWLKQQPWVDADRLALRGWSFGGFLTLYAMTHSDAFTAGIAGGSVTDWREYDAFYTERYMGLPQQNAEGYDKTAPVRHADKLHGRVLLIHGEEDDNVHPSGTLRMVEALQRAGKDFELMIYPGSAHGITDPQQSWHLAQMTHRFLKQELGVESGRRP